MTSANISKLGKLFRKPYYWFWRLVEKIYEGNTYGILVPWGQRVFMPWFDSQSDSDFAQIIKEVRHGGAVTTASDRCYILHQLLKRSLHLNGDVVECGVYVGSTAQLLAATMSRYDKQKRFLHLFDSFEGMPEISNPDRDYHSEGDFNDTSLLEVQKRLKKYESICKYYPGFIPNTLVGVESISTYSFVHIDVDIYQSVVDCLDWFYPKLVAGGIIVFDDYGFYPYRYAGKAAADAFFRDLPEDIIALPTGQAIVMKL
jgi:O-methyltransferase